MNNIKWGIIGTGRIAHLFAQALCGTQGGEPYAVASRSTEKAQSFAEEFGFAKAYGSYRELAEDADVDIVYIATPMHSHYDDAMLCLKNGRHVLCEKSLTINARQSEEIIGFAKQKGLFFMEAMWMKLRPAYLKVKEWIASGAIGTPEYVKADFNNHMPFDPNDRTFLKACGGGALLDLGVYPLTLAADILGNEPDEIISAAHIGHEEVDISNSVILKYKGAFACLNSGFEFQCKNNAIISGDKGSAVLGDWFHCTSDAALYDRDGKLVESHEFPPKVNGYEYEIEEAQRCLREGLTESPFVTHEDTLAVMRIMDECRRQWGMKYDGE